MSYPEPSLNQQVLVRIQEGLALVPRPFAALAAELGATEDEVLAVVRDLEQRGWIRRFGGVFDSRMLGCSSTLCAVRTQPGARSIEAVAAAVCPHPGVTHCYERVPCEALDGARRADMPDLWFTLTVPAARFAAELADLAAACAPCEVHNLPARRRFKLEVVFRPGDQGSSAAGPDRRRPDPPGAAELSPCERAVGRVLQGNIALSATPFAGVAEKLDCPEEDVLAVLRRWRDSAVLRRVSAVLYHRRAGFTANGLGVWAVRPDCIEACGRRLAARGTITHCYERPPFPEFPYTLYAMLHADSWEHLQARFAAACDTVKVRQSALLCSVREFKKSSPRVFDQL